jgi:protein gp37
VSTGSAIEWTQVTWNPVTGCDRISPGCDHCYALALAARLKRMGQAKYQTNGKPPTSGPGFGVATHPDTLGAPFGWRRPRLVFVNSMSDLFHAHVPEAFIAAVFGVMHEAEQHTFQVLTKRPHRMATLLGSERIHGQVVAEVMGWRQQHDGLELSWPARNVWLGTSIETDRYTWRADQLRNTPAAVRFLSLEPLLGPLPSLDLAGIDWVIVGGESGPDHRPVDLGWVRQLRDRCLEAGVAFFFKQWGGRTPKAGGRLLDGRTWDQLPARMAQASTR